MATSRGLHQLTGSAALGALRFVFSLSGATLPGLIGIPGASGVINILWAGGFAALPCLITRRFGSSTIAGVVYGLLALPLPLSGPPGFLPKILIGATTGLMADLVFAVLGARIGDRASAVLAGAAAQTLLGLEIVWFGQLLAIPGIEKLVHLQLSTIGIASTVVGGALSGYLGWLVFRSLRDSPVVRRMRS